MRTKLFFFCLVWLLGSNLALADKIVLIEHDPIMPHKNKTYDYSIPASNYFLECFQDEAAAESAFTQWDYGTEFHSSQVTLDKDHTSLITLIRDDMPNANNIINTSNGKIQLANPTGKVIFQNTGDSYLLFVTCCYTTDLNSA